MGSERGNQLSLFFRSPYDIEANDKDMEDEELCILLVSHARHSLCLLDYRCLYNRFSEDTKTIYTMHERKMHID